MWGQVRELLRHLVREELLVVEERGYIDEGEETQLTRCRIVLEGDFAVALL